MLEFFIEISIFKFCFCGIWNRVPSVFFLASSPILSRRVRLVRLSRESFLELDYKLQKYVFRIDKVTFFWEYLYICVVQCIYIQVWFIQRSLSFKICQAYSLQKVYQKLSLFENEVYVLRVTIKIKLLILLTTYVCKWEWSSFYQKKLKQTCFILPTIT